jgi:periodic tryptophan protein 2
MYSLDEGRKFDPFDLDVTVTPETTLRALDYGDYLKSLVMSFRLNLSPLMTRVFLAVPASDISFVTRECPDVYLARLMRLVAYQADEGPHLEFCLRWIEAIFTCHGRLLKERKGEFAPEVRVLMRAINNIEKNIRKVAQGNGFMVEYLLRQPLKKGIEGVRNDDILMLETLDPGAEAEVNEAGEGEWLGLDE